MLYMLYHLQMPKVRRRTLVFPGGSPTHARGEGVHHPAVLLVLPLEKVD